MASKRDII